MRVSVITPTWQRRQLLMDRCAQSVFVQTHEDVEHVIVSDGPDPDLAMAVSLDLWRRPRKTRPLLFDQLPEHREGPVDYGSRARNRGLELATGDYVAYLDDDNAYWPNHVAALAKVLEVSSADFVYSRMLVHWANGDYEVGSPVPAYGGIDTSLLMHRAGVPQKYGMWPEPGEFDGDQHAPDWGVVSRWLDAGATWAHIPQITVDYYRS